MKTNVLGRMQGMWKYNYVRFACLESGGGGSKAELCPPLPPQSPHPVPPPPRLPPPVSSGRLARGGEKEVRSSDRPLCKPVDSIPK